MPTAVRAYDGAAGCCRHSTGWPSGSRPHCARALPFLTTFRCEGDEALVEIAMGPPGRGWGPRQSTAGNCRSGWLSFANGLPVSLRLELPVRVRTVRDMRLQPTAPLAA